MNRLGEKYHGAMAMLPLSMPDPHEEGRRPSLFHHMNQLLADHYRRFVLPAAWPVWQTSPPCLPYTHEELKGVLKSCFRRDEKRVLDILGNLDSESASIIAFLDLTREAVSEAMDKLKNQRTQQVTLLTILAATRFRILTKEGLVPTQCPRPGCGKRDSFWHLLECYGLQTSVEDGPHVVPFLLYLAQRIPAITAPVPWGDPKTYNPEERTTL